MNRMTNGAHVALTVLMGMGVLYAAEAKASCLSEKMDSLKTQRIGDVEVMARKARSAVSSVTPQQIISASDLQLLGVSSVGDATKRMAGVSVHDYGGIGGMQTVSVRSLGACHTAVSYDGIVVSNMQAGQIDVSRFSLSNVRQLSVAIGQGSDLMQSARHYASAGILSLESQGLEECLLQENEKKPWSMQLAGKTGSWGLFSPSLRYSQRLGAHTAFSVDGNLVRADGVYPFTIQNGRQKEHHRRYNSDILSGQGEMNLLHRWESSELSAKVAYYHSKRGLPGVVILYNPETKERMWDENCFAQMMLKTKLSSQLDLHVRLKYAHAWSKYEDYNVKYAGGKQTDVDRQNEYYASATLGYTLSPSWSLALAEDVAIGNLRNNIVSQPNPTRYSSQTALSLRWKRERWQVDGNLVGTYIAEKASDVQISGTSASSVKARIPADRKRLSPSVALGYRLLPQEQLYLRGMMKCTYRVPTFTDMYYLRIGNTNLKPENATEWNLGLTWAHRFAGFSRGEGSRGLSIRATLDTYYNKVTDKIVAFPTTYVWKMVNFGKVAIHGIDATLSLSQPLGKKMAIDVDAAYTYQHAVDKTSREKSYYGNQLPYTPRHSGNVSAVWRNPWVNLGWQMMAVGERWSMIQGTDEYRMKPYQDHSFTLSKDIRKRLSLSLSLLNAFNRQYEVIQYYPMPGRSWQATATLVL